MSNFISIVIHQDEFQVLVGLNGLITRIILSVVVEEIELPEEGNGLKQLYILFIF